MTGPYQNRDLHATLDLEEWTPPDFREAFKDKLPALSDLPLLILHNKFNQEWGEEPTNFIDIPTLLYLMDMLKGRYTIVYMRPYTSQHLRGYIGDMNLDLVFDDHEQIRLHHPEVHLAHELLDQHPEMADFNQLQLALHAQADAFISVLGGNAIIASYFAGTNIIYAVNGQEAHNTEYQDVYPRLSPGGEGKIFHAHDYQELIDLAREQFIEQPIVEAVNRIQHPIVDLTTADLEM